MIGSTSPIYIELGPLDDHTEYIGLLTFIIIQSILLYLYLYLKQYRINTKQTQTYTKRMI